MGHAAGLLMLQTSGSDRLPHPREKGAGLTKRIEAIIETDRR